MTRRMRPVSGDVWAPCLSLGQVRALWRWLLPLCQADLAPVWGTGVIHHHQEITLLKQSWSIIKLGHLKCDTDLSETEESRVTCIAQSAGIVNVEICLSLAATGGWWRAVTLKTGRERQLVNIKQQFRGRPRAQRFTLQPLSQNRDIPGPR